MILLDSDVMIDLLRQYPPATGWFDALDDEEELLLPGYVVMELIIPGLQTIQPYEKTT